MDWGEWWAMMRMGGTLGVLRLDELEHEEMDWNCSME
jgi:hypothetical protein